MFDAQVREQGLTLARARLLLILAKDDKLTQRELAEALEIEQASLVALLDGLEKQGLIERLPIEGDRRAKRIMMTDQARAETRAIVGHVDGLREQLLAGINDRDLKTANRVLMQIGRNIGVQV